MNFSNRFSKIEIYRTIQVGLLAITLVVGWFLLLHDTGLNLGDEGYLWHNAQRTLEGGVPIRDFRSYDPGRYYWSALWFAWLGPGLSSLRISLAAFQFLGLFAALLAIRRAIRSWQGLILSSIVILLWMYPRHKIFEISLQ